ncbi:helix-turn-helix transcriptional regulator [Acinetobacter proteolyticus]|uniref:HTH cro/C1-type domain-containing protein n=1 Tax=Acinetobacter proteolyticus TaxID=1776741 RepID=A0A2N0WEV5_9GAMM|nr:helix-turn-helix transcriptional regulator [Acinetobacter proteolyticus]MBK5649339.1 helix-turn-helix transcriptional regulator [Acinetobacter sp.]PKF33400.1 hypothetical protein CW311_11395 [Acinetobacter proteolyticus]
MANSFGERLKFLRAANNLSQQELAELVGISRKQISDYEVRNSIPRSTTIYKLAQALMVKPTDLLPEDLNKEDHLPNRLPSLIKLHIPPKIYDRLLEATEKK